MSGESQDDASAFLHRLLRLDPNALVRLRPAGTGGVLLWAALPWDVLVCTQVAWPASGDRTVPATLLLAEPAAPAELPAEPPARPGGAAALSWRGSLPPGPGAAVEVLAGADVARVAQQAAESLRQVTAEGVAGRAVGQRQVRDALLDHVPILVDLADRRIDISQRLVQAVVRMGFLGSGPAPADVVVRVEPGWIGLATPYGAAWRRTANPLSVRPVR